jgi:hypothetical protein
MSAAEDWAAIHPLGDWARYPKIVAITDALMQPAFVLAKLAINPSRQEVDDVDEVIGIILGGTAERRLIEDAIHPAFRKAWADK